MRAFRRQRVAVVLAMTTCLGVAGEGRQQSEELARRQYQQGLDFLRDGKFAEALRDFQTVADGSPGSSVADDALLEIARHQMVVARDFDTAQRIIESLIKKYPTSDATPSAYVVAGQIALARGRQPADFDRALAEFQRVPRYFPGTEAVPAALLARADTLRIAGRCAEAVDQYAQLAVEYPRSGWAPQANIGASRCLIAQNRAFEAMAGLQLAVRNGMAAEHAARARALNTILYRLYVRPPQPPFAFSGTTFGGSTGRMRDVVALGTSGGSLIAVSENGLSVLDLANKGAVARTTKLENARGVYSDPEGRSAIYSSRAVLRGTEPPVTLSVPKPDKSPRLLEDVTAMASLSTGEIVVADGNGPMLHRFNQALKVVGPVTQGRAHRLAVGSLDQIAGLDRGDKSISVWTPDGKPLVRIPAKGQTWQIDEPVDIAFDAFDHLYVLDRGLGTVWVFAISSAPRLVTFFTLPEKSAGAFRRPTALALDTSGRLYIHDERAEKVQVYQ